jgi:hypothetical protein
MKKYPLCIGSKIRSKGMGRGLGVGKGKGPIRQPIKAKTEDWEGVKIVRDKEGRVIAKEIYDYKTGKLLRTEKLGRIF